MLALTILALAAAVPTQAATTGMPEESHVSTNPRANLASLIANDDYPVGAVLLGMEGTVGVQMKVDPSGKVTDCTVQQSSGFIILDSQTCRIFQARARFEPARDSMGRPMAGTANSRITWRIADTMPIVPWSFRVGVLLGPDGTQTKCSLEVGGALKRKRDSYVLACSELGSGIVVPPDLARAMLGNKIILVFDRQFVPGVFHSIDSPPDLKRFTLLGREVISLMISADGAVIGCKRKASEGSFLPSPGACDTFERRQFTKPAKSVSPLTATATLSVYSLRVH